MENEIDDVERRINQHGTISTMMTNEVEDYILQPIVWSLIGRGLKYQQIVDHICQMGNLGQISLSTLKRRLNEWSWNKHPPPDEEIREKIILEILVFVSTVHPRNT